MHVSAKMHSRVLPITGGGGRVQGFDITPGDLSHTTVYLFHKAADFMSIEQISLSYKNKINSSHCSKETQNRVVPGLASKERNLFVICQNSVLIGPTYVCRHTDL